MAELRQMCGLVLFASLAAVPSALQGQGGQPDARGSQSKVTQTLPLVFESNEGQYASDVAFVGRTERYSVAIGSQDVRFSLPGAHGSSQVVLSLEGGHAAAPAGLAEAPFRTNYFVGSKASDYRLGVRNYNRVGLSHVYPGVDVQFYAAGSTIEHDFFVAPGADASQIQMRIQAQGRAGSLTPKGDLLIAGDEGELLLRKPVAYQSDPQGHHTEVPVEFALSSGKKGEEVRFHLGAYDHSRQLVIDPVIQYGSFFDGKAGSTATALTSDAAGNVYLTGYTNSAAANFAVAKTNLNVAPSVNDSVNTARSTTAVFVAKFNPAGAASPVAWMSYFGGDKGDSASTSIALQASKDPAFVAIGGSTFSADVPTSPGSVLPNVTGSAKRGFVASFSTSTGSLAASTYLDSAPGVLTASTEVNALAMDATGNVYAVGSATGSALPVTANAIGVDNAVLTSTARKGFLFALTPALASGGLVSYLNGDQVADTALTSVALSTSGNLYVGGYTAGSFPKAGVYGSGNMYTHNPADRTGNDAFAAEIVPSAASSTLQYSTWLSGSADEKLNGIALDASGNLFLFGQTASTDLQANTTFTLAGSAASAVPAAGQLGAKPVTASFPQKTGVATISGFAAKLDPTGQPMVVTYLGAGGDDVVTAGVVDANGSVYAAGHSSSSASMSYSKAKLLPTNQDLTSSSMQHGFLLGMPNDLSAVNSIANIGGNAGPDSAVALGLDSTGSVYVGGNVSSTSAYTSAGAFEAARTAAAGSSAYVAKISPQDATTLPIVLTAITCTQLAADGSCAATSAASPAVGYPDPVAYPNAAGGTAPQENVNYNFTITQSGTPLLPLPALGVTISIPAVSYLTYENLSVYDVTTGETPVVCTSSGPGTCTLAVYPTNPALPATGTNYDTLNVVLQAHVTSQPPAGTTTITVTGTLSDVAAVLTPQSATEISNVVVPAQLSITPGNVSTAVNGSVYTTEGGVVQTDTQVGYSFTVTNAPGAGTATNASFTFPPSTAVQGFKVSTMMMGATACTVNPGGSGGTCSGLTINAGSSVTITVTGTYPDDALLSGQQLSASPFTVTANAPFSSPAATFDPKLTLKRGVHFSVTGTLSASTRADTNFYLADSVTYTIAVTNNGPSASSGSEQVTINLPTSPATFTFTSTSPAVACTGSTCTASLLALASGANSSGTQPLSIVGNFQDSLTNDTVKAAAQKVTFALPSVALNSEFDSNDGPTNVTAPFLSVERFAGLTTSVASIMPPGAACAGGSASCLYMQNATTGPATYTFEIDNSGPDVSVGTVLKFTLPSAPAAGGVNHALTTTASVIPTVTPQVLSTGTSSDFGAPLSCNYPATSASSPASNVLTCSGNLPVGKVVVSGSLTADNSTVPATVAFVTTAAPTGTPGLANVTEGALGAPADVNLLPIEIDRAAHLVTTKTITGTGTGTAAAQAAPFTVSLENTNPSITSGVYDTVGVVTQVANSNLNVLPGATLTDLLPQYFRIATVPTSSGGVTATCKVNGATIAVGYTTDNTNATRSMTCTIGTLVAGNAAPSSAGTAKMLGTAQVTLTYTGKFIDKGVTAADITGAAAAAKVSAINNVDLGSAVASTTLAADPYNAADASGAGGTFNVNRSVHLILSKVRNTAVDSPAASFADKSPNLDEKPSSTSFGANDEIEYDVTVANSGVNQALGVQVNDLLPPYFNVENAYFAKATTTTTPLTNGVSCAGAASSAPLYNSGSGTPTVSCTYGTAANPLALAPGASTAATIDKTTAVTLVYQGKFQDNAPAVDDIAANTTTYTVTSAAGAATATSPVQSQNNGTDNGSALLTYHVQRVTHLVLVPATVPLTDLSGSLLTKAADGTSIAAQAEPSAVTGAGPVINCIRYKIYVQNTGPNIARTPQLSVVLPSGLNLVGAPTTAVSAPNASGEAALADTCSASASAPTTVAGASLVPTSQSAGASLAVDFDGYFGLNTLTNTNALGGMAPTYSSLSDGPSATPSSNDSGAGTIFAAVKATPVTVVNTPYGSNFIVKPFSTTATQPITLSFGTVSTAGITNLTVSTTSAGLTLPTGKSPDPRYGTTNLYKSGANPRFYGMETTAIPVAGINPTGVCIASETAGAALADFFAKPERVLLWALAGLPSGTTLYAVPNITTPYTGDITTSVAALGGGVNGMSYLEAGGPGDLYVSTNPNVSPILPPVQSQPLKVCGQLNGFAIGTTPSQQAVLAVLEPVNFSPVIVTNSTTISQTPGKGVSEVSFLFPTSFDYNNNDPCFVSSSTSTPSSRQSCDDNLALTTWIYGGEALIPSRGHIVGPLSPDLAVNYTAVTTPFEVQASATLYELVADQLGEINYQGAKFCDPGVGGSSYTPFSSVAMPACPISASTLTAATSTAPAQETVFTYAQVAQLIPSLNGGSSALIVLPPAATPSSATTPVLTGYTAAAGTVTAGQTVGFLWRLSDVTGASGTYNLTCYEVDAATQNTQIPFTAGISCQVPATDTLPTNPAIYIVTQGNLYGRNSTPAWRVVSGAVFAGLLAPFLLFRRRLAVPKQLVLLVLLSLGAAAGLTGCGSGSTGSSTTTATASGTYWFRVSGTPTAGGATYTSTAFSVKVVGGS